jgi:hypothetical protein
MFTGMWKLAAIVAMFAMAAPTFAAGQSAAATDKPAKKTATKKKITKPAEPAVTAEDIRALRQMLEQQQAQIQALQNQLAARDQASQQAAEAARQAQSSATDAATKAAAVQSAADQESATVAKLKSVVDDVKLNQQNAALSTQEDQKRLAAAEGTLGRFRWTGDMRVRQEDFFVACPTTSACHPRIRERIRVRLGVEGKLGEDFIGGIAFASGVITDPTSTNETLTNVFEKKTVGFDRGYITYNPQAHKWLSLTGGKFAYTWTRTPVTFDSDLNPEGFGEKLSFDFKNPVFRNFTVNGMQLLFNEKSQGADSYAVGGQLSSKLQLGKWVTFTPSYSVLNWINANIILGEPTSVTGGTTVGPFAPNGLTNATKVVGGTTVYASHFTYSDFIGNFQIKTYKERFPVNLLFEFEDNLRAASDQSKAFYADVNVGRTANPKDFQIGYSYIRQEQDSVISAFNESDQRAPTNVDQQRFYINFKIQKNTVLSWTQWIGHTLDTTLQNSARQPGVTAGAKDPYLKRAQFDVVYTF